MIDKFYKVEGHAGLMKNPRTGVVMNSKTNEIKNARKRKKIRLNDKEENQELKQEVHELKTEMSEIKDLLKQLVEK